MSDSGSAGHGWARWLGVGVAAIVASLGAWAEWFSWVLSRQGPGGQTLGAALIAGAAAAAGYVLAVRRIRPTVLAALVIGVVGLPAASAHWIVTEYWADLAARTGEPQIVPRPVDESLDECHISDTAAEGTNVAFGRPVTVSNETADGPGRQAVDGDAEASWNSGGFPPAWIEIDLGEPMPLREVRLSMARSPLDGRSEQHVLGRADQGVLTMIGGCAGPVADNETIVISVDPALDPVRFARIEIAASNSWAALREVEIYAAVPPASGETFQLDNDATPRPVVLGDGQPVANGIGDVFPLDWHSEPCPDPAGDWSYTHVMDPGLT